MSRVSTSFSPSEYKIFTVSSRAIFPILFGSIGRFAKWPGSGLVTDHPETRRARIVEARQRRLDKHGFPRATEDQKIGIINAFINSVDEEAVCALASLYNNGVKCRVVDKSRGSFNLCFFVEFDAEKGEQLKKWVVRLPIRPSVERPWEKVLNEVATISLIKEENKDKGETNGSDKNDNIIKEEGQVFLITDFVPGANLDKKLLTTADQEHRRCFYMQLLEILAELRQLEFPNMGSLLPGETDDTPNLGPMLSMSENTLRMSPPPVLTSATDFMRYKFGVMSEFFFSPVGDMKIDELRKELYAIQALEPRFPGVISPALDRGPFILNHLDLRAHNIVVDKQLRIRGVIDWEFTSTIPQQLFMPPSWITGHDSKETSKVLHAEFREVLRAQAKEDPRFRQLEMEWYGEANETADEPLSSDTVQRFCIAHILRKPSDAVEIFYDFMDDDASCSTNEGKEARLARFCKDYPDLEVEAQRRCEESQAYAKYLSDNGIFETRMDRILAMKAEMKAKYGWT